MLFWAAEQTECKQTNHTLYRTEERGRDSQCKSRRFQLIFQYSSTTHKKSNLIWYLDQAIHVKNADSMYTIFIWRLNYSPAIFSTSQSNFSVFKRKMVNSYEILEYSLKNDKDRNQGWNCDNYYLPRGIERPKRGSKQLINMIRKKQQDTNHNFIFDFEEKFREGQVEIWREKM